MLVGGHAVAIHGFPRNTADIDIWIECSPKNAELIVEAIQQFGFDTPELDANLFLTRPKVIRMGIAPVRIEVLTELSGLEFEDAYPRLIHYDIEGLSVPVISLEDLRTNKAAAGRPKDRIDLEELPDPSNTT